MKKILLSFLLLFSSCYPDFDSLYLKRFTVKCMDFYTNLTIDEAKLRSNVQLVGELLAQYGVTSKSFCEELYGLDIAIRADENWSCDKIECFGAAHESPLYLETDRRTKSLLHEILHAIEFKRGISDTIVHKNWDKKSFYQMDRIYMTEYDPVN